MANLKLAEKSLAAIPAANSHASTCPGGRACGCPLQSYHWDTELVGFGVVVGRTGIKTFIACAWVNRKKPRVKIGVAGAPRPDGYVWTVALARIEARKLLAPHVGRRGPQRGEARDVHASG